MVEVCVLVVDDSELIINIVSSILSELHGTINVNILRAHNREEVFEYYKTKDPDIVFLDIIMPQGDMLHEEEGWLTLKSIKEHDSEAKVVIVSSIARQESKDKAHELGAADYITKPFSKESIKNVLLAYLTVVGFKVLVVDDSFLIIKLISQALNKMDSMIHLKTIEARNGVEALSKYKEERPDVVFLDVMMPYMDGMEALKQILEYNSDAKVVMVSSLRDEESIKNAMDAGALSYITKPFKEEEIQEVMKGFITVLESE
jgi:two-component system, chemotaxis family, chemotaxis protein CheY